MQKFWSRNRKDALADELRARRPVPRAELVSSLARQIEADRPRQHRRFRPALAAAFTVTLLVAFAVFGGTSYASSVRHQATRIVQIFNVNVSQSAQGGNATQSVLINVSTTIKNSRGGGHDDGGDDDDDDGGDDDQYRPGKGCGDKNHVHRGGNECHGHGHGHGHGGHGRGGDR